LNYYIDTSVLLRVVLGQAGIWPGWGGSIELVTSALTEVEALRTIDRRHRQGLLAPSEYAEALAVAQRNMLVFDTINLSPAILRRAGDAFPLPLGTLDAIHLASALAYRVETDKPVTMVTHDKQLAAVARACGLEVEGL
jgi:predicted nucleic acid-binding protein